MKGLSQQTFIFLKGGERGVIPLAKGDIIDMPLAPSDMIMNET